MEAMSVPPAPPVAVSQRDYILPGVGVALAVLGAFGTWVKGPGISSGGMDHDGKVTIFLAIIGAIVIGLAYVRKTAPSRVGLGILAVLLMVIAAVDIGDVKDTNIDGFFGSSIDLTVGWGLWLTMISGIVLAAAVALRIIKR